MKREEYGIWREEWCAVGVGGTIQWYENTAGMQNPIKDDQDVQKNVPKRYPKRKM